ncbi:hypothetical protein [Sinorhizobium fredii]|uniref:hypothetical protein n=1 Tax=Rhizobium fredii TaxID=380 RepID=UPI0004ACC75C|nr:hypothetical protein [Sinorhizobium fredii]AWM24010.1 hypothetical protein AOX55_0000733 [Sinorhizobium fredii CCBAU 25509]
MLQALVSGKAGRLPGFDETISWRNAFRISEDLLTAAVFGRLAYLEGPVFWRILRRTFGSSLPDHRVAELANVEFWPRWDESGETGGSVEPDVFLDFNLGDPQISIRIIVEAKFGTSPTQYADQWLRQWSSYHEAKEGDGSRVFLAAIGGLGRNVEATVEKLAGRIAAAGHDINVVAAGWDRLLDALQEERTSASRSAARIIDDMVTALGMAGYQHLSLMGGLGWRRREWNPHASGLLKNLE